MIASPFACSVVVRRAGVVLGATPASVAPCVEDARVRGVLAGRIPNDGSLPSFTVAPVWARAGPPAVAGLTLACAGEPVGTYGLGVFVAKARALIRDLLLTKALTDQDLVDWGVIAIEQRATPAGRFRARATRTPYPFHTRCLGYGAPGTFHVTVDAPVLDAIRDIVLANPAVEVAGLLVGSLDHDPDRCAAALTVTGQVPVPAGRGGCSGSHFAFGPDSFLAMRKSLGGAAGSACGFWHSHPPCAACPTKSQCTVDTVFFSPDDVQVQQSVFPAAYMIALVAGKFAERPATDLGFRLYQWERGAMVERPLELTIATDEP